MHTAQLKSALYNETAHTEIYTLSLHDALPISDTTIVRRMNVADFEAGAIAGQPARSKRGEPALERQFGQRDRKSTRLNSSHLGISYAVFCLKKKKRKTMYMNKIRCILINRSSV